MCLLHPAPNKRATLPAPPPQLSCGGERQQKILAAARQQGGSGQEGGRTGGGAMLLSIAGSSHNTFAGGRSAVGAQEDGLVDQWAACCTGLACILGIFLAATCLQTSCRCLARRPAGCCFFAYVAGHANRYSMF